MKFYSEILNKLYDTKAELVKAEQLLAEKEAKEKAKALKAEREKRAKAVEAALKEAREAQDKATKLLNEFCKDYGSFHTTMKDAPKSFISLFDLMFGVL